MTEGEASGSGGARGGGGGGTGALWPVNNVEDSIKKCFNGAPEERSFKILYMYLYFCRHFISLTLF